MVFPFFTFWSVFSHILCFMSLPMSLFFSSFHNTSRLYLPMVLLTFKNPYFTGAKQLKVCNTLAWHLCSVLSAYMELFTTTCNKSVKTYVDFSGHFLCFWFCFCCILFGDGELNVVLNLSHFLSIYFVFVWTAWGICSSQGTTLVSQFSPPPTLFLGIKVRSSDLAANAFTFRAISLALKTEFLPNTTWTSRLGFF